MRIKHDEALRLEYLVRAVFDCDRAGMGGYIDANHFASNLFDATLIAIALLWNTNNNEEVG